MPFIGRVSDEPPDPKDQAAAALVEVGGTATEPMLLGKVVDLFGPQEWTRSLQRFHLELSNAIAGGSPHYFVRRPSEEYEVTALGRAKAKLEKPFFRRSAQCTAGSPVRARPPPRGRVPRGRSSRCPDLEWAPGHLPRAAARFWRLSAGGRRNAW